MYPDIAVIFKRKGQLSSHSLQFPFKSSRTRAERLSSSLSIFPFFSDQFPSLLAKEGGPKAISSPFWSGCFICGDNEINNYAGTTGVKLKCAEIDSPCASISTAIPI